MEIAFFIYLTSKAEVISKMFVLLSISCLLILSILAIIVNDKRCKISDQVEKEKHKYPLALWHGKLLLFAAIILGIISALVPSERTMYLMAGGYMGQKAFQSETGVRIVKIINNKLDSYLEQIEKSTIEKVNK